MRRICWYALAMLLLFSLAGCDLSGSQSQQATSSSSSLTTNADANAVATDTPTPDPTAAITSTATATATATATPRPKPTARPKPKATVSTKGSSGTSSPLSALEKQLQQQLFALINHDRADQGLYAYVLNSTMSGGALTHSKRMSVCGMSHQCPGEPDPCQRVSNEGISWTSCGENVGYTSPNPTDWLGVEKIEQSMLAEQPPDDGHRLNLLSSSFHRVGVGIYVDSKGLVWITEDFAS